MALCAVSGRHTLVPTPRFSDIQRGFLWPSPAWRPRAVRGKVRVWYRASSDHRHVRETGCRSNDADPRSRPSRGFGQKRFSVNHNVWSLYWYSSYINKGDLTCLDIVGQQSVHVCAHSQNGCLLTLLGGCCSCSKLSVCNDADVAVRLSLAAAHCWTPILSQHDTL